MSKVTPLPGFESEWQIETPYSFKGLTLVIEYLAGSMRTKIRGDSAPIAGVMPAAYGRILGTTDRHGEELDVYISSDMDATAPIFVIDQNCLNTGTFDEHKVMVGFPTVDDAMATYIEAFGDGLGKRRLGAITTFTDSSFALWLKGDGNNLLPASKFVDPQVEVRLVSGVVMPRSPGGHAPSFIDEAGGVQVSLPDMNAGPKIHVSANEDGGRDYTLNLFSAINTEVWTNCFDRAVRILDLATENDTFTIKIASPGGSVFLMGRLVSAIKLTKALVVTEAQGSVASAATAIWAEGHVRKILPGSYFMQHMSSQFMSGKTTAIAAKTTYCMNYISQQLARLVEIKLFTQEEVDDMIYKSADIFISGREAAARCGKVSGEFAPAT